MKIPAYIFDIDGTLALKGDRDPYDYSKVLQDELNKPIAKIARRLGEGNQVLFVTGRLESSKPNTEKWIATNLPSLSFYYQVNMPILFMRPESQKYEKDYIIKEQIYRKHIEPYYKVIAVFDDRRQVVDMWRRIGLTCLQVAEGDF